MGKLTSGSSLARNTVWNLIGQVAPLALAIVAIPFLIRGLGTYRFGVVTLAWVVIGYFSLFDLGVGRALTKVVAEKLGMGQNQELPALIWTALFLMFLLGLVGALIVTLLSPWLVHDALNVPEALEAETLQAFRVLAISIPIVIITAGMRGILEAHQRFDIINSVRVPMVAFMFFGPLLVLPFSQSLFWVVTVLVTGRLLVGFVYLVLCLYLIPTLRHGIALCSAVVGPLIRLGSWMTVTNIVGPFMLYLDRFLIGGLLSVASVAYYATPYEVVTKLLLIPLALAAVLFPAFSTSFAQDRSHTQLLYNRGVKYIFLSLFPISLLIVTLASEGLDLWLGTEFAGRSTRVLQWLTVGVFLNSLAQMPFALIQGTGRPDLTAKLHLIELPFYLVMVWRLIGICGIEGAAIAWVTRIGVDTIFLFAMAQRFLPAETSITKRKVLAMVAALFIMALASLPMSLAIKGLFLLLTLAAFVSVSWFLILAPDERVMIGNRFKPLNCIIL